MNLPQKRIHTTVLLVVLLGTMFQADALAYLDPGTGSMFVQGLIASVAAAGYTLRVYWSRIQLWIKRPGAPTDPRAEAPASDPT